MSKLITCHCGGCDHPHHLGQQECLNEDTDQPVCRTCGCNDILIGLGRYQCTHCGGADIALSTQTWNVDFHDDGSTALGI